MNVAAATSVRSRYATLQAAGWVMLGVLILYLPTFASMVSIWNRDATFAHGFAIPLICAWLLWQRRESLAAAPIAPAQAGFACSAALTLLWLLADLADVQVIAQAAATAMLPAAVWAVLGTQFVRRAAFPLAYLVFAVPWGDIFVPALMRFTTEFTVAAVRLVGVPIFRDGNFFSLPSGNFEVVKACSGVRYLIASLALGVLYAGLSYRSWRRRAAFVGLSIVVPIIANGLRAFGIVMLAHASQMQYAVGVDHLIYGWLFFGVVMALLFWIGNSFMESKAASDAADTGPVPARPLAAARPSLRRLGALLAILAAGVLIERCVTYTSRPNLAALLAKQLPASAVHWQGPTPLQSEWRAAFAQDESAAGARYDTAAGSVLLFVRDYASGAGAATALTSRTLIAEETGPWRLAELRVVEIAAGVQVRAAQVIGPDGMRLEVWFWQRVNGELAGAALRTAWLRLRSWLQLEYPVSNLVAVAAPGVEGEQARSLLTAYLQQYPQLLGAGQ